MFNIIEFNEENEKDAFKLSVCKSQQHFIETFHETLIQQQTNAYQIKWEIKLIYKEELLIGYVMYGINPNDDLWVDRFMIDCKYQDQGYGFYAFEAVLQYLKAVYPTIEKVFLSIKPDNAKAMRLYEKLGFTYTDLLDGDEPIYMKKT
jgi:diamine N-acetyltransferase